MSERVVFNIANQHRAVDMPQDRPDEGKDLIRRCLGVGSRPSFEMMKRELGKSICELVLVSAGAFAEPQYQ